MRCCEAQSGLLNLRMDMLSEQEVEVGPSYASKGGSQAWRRISLKAKQ